MNHKQLIEALIPSVRNAGDKIMNIYKKPIVADQKADGSPVTEADRQAEAVILASLSAIVPGLRVISEENVESHRVEAPERFVLVDPLDGTREFLKRDGKGCFTVNIALVEANVPVLGIVYAPALDRLFYGAAGFGAHEVNGSEVKEIQCQEQSENERIAVASVSHRDEETDRWLEENNICRTVSIGSSLKFCLVATGEADIYPRFGPTMEWDTAAGDAVLRAAGGRVENPDGTPFVYGKPQYRNGSFIAKSICC